MAADHLEMLMLQQVVEEVLLQQEHKELVLQELLY
jgi:hypothetical protein